MSRQVVAASLLWSLAACLAGGCAAPPLSPRAPTPGVPHFRVQSYNVFFRAPGDPSTLEAIGRDDADVVALQEVNAEWVRVIEARYADAYPHRLFHPEEGAGGYAVLSRFPLVDGGTREAAHHPGWHVLVDTNMGPIELLLVHLRAHFKGPDDPIANYLRSDEDHRDDIESFAQACSGSLPVLVMGDFNEETDGDAVRWLQDRGFRSVLSLFRPGQPTYRHRYALGGQFDAAIDHIFFSDAFVPLDAYVIDAGGSDHYPVVAHFESAR